MFVRGFSKERRRAASLVGVEFPSSAATMTTMMRKHSCRAVRPAGQIALPEAKQDKGSLHAPLPWDFSPGIGPLGCGDGAGYSRWSAGDYRDLSSMPRLGKLGTDRARERERERQALANANAANE